jgi:hypothetical protein
VTRIVDSPLYVPRRKQYDRAIEQTSQLDRLKDDLTVRGLALLQRAAEGDLTSYAAGEGTTAKALCDAALLEVIPAKPTPGSRVRAPRRRITELGRRLLEHLAMREGA